MHERNSAFDTPRDDSRRRCILCESVLPAAIERESSAVCVRCWALAPDERRFLRDRAMARVLRTFTR